MEGSTEQGLMNTWGLRQVVCLGEDHPRALEHREEYVYVVSSIHWPEDRDHGNGVKGKYRQRDN